MIGLGGNTTLGIGLSITLVDRFSRRASAITQQMQAMGQSAAQVKRNMTNALQGLQTASTVMVGAGYGAVKFMQLTTGEFAKFEYLMKSVQAVAGDTKLPMEALGRVGKNAKELAVEFGILPTKVAESMFVLAKAGIDTESQLQKITSSVLALSAAADEPADKMAHDLVSVLNTFQIEAKNASVVADMLAKSANEVQVDVQDLFESIKYSGNTARTLNIPLEQMLANLAFIGSKGLPGSMAGISLQNALKELSRSLVMPKKNQRAAMAALGITPEELLTASDSLRDMAGLGKLLAERTKGMAPRELTTFLELLAGTRGGRFLAPLIKDYGKLQELQQEIMNSGGSAQSIAQKRLDSVAGAQKKLAAAVSEFKIAAGSAYQGVLMAALPILTKFLRVISAVASHPMGKFLLMAATGGMLLVGAIGAILLPMATLGILLVNSKVGLTQMRIAGTWAFNSIANAISRAILQLRIYSGLVKTNAYGTAQYPAGTVINGRNVGGQFYNPSTVAAAGAATGGAAARSGGFFARMASRGGSMLFKVAGAAAMLFSVFQILTDFVQGRLIPAIAGATGGILGFMAGGPIGALIGMGLGSMVGGMFGDEPSPQSPEAKRKALFNYRFGNSSNAEPINGSMDRDALSSRFTSGTSMQYLENQAAMNKSTQINIYQDGKKTLEKFISDRDEDIHLNSELY